MSKDREYMGDDLLVAVLMIVNPVVWVLCIMGMVKLWLEGRRPKYWEETER